MRAVSSGASCRDKHARVPSCDPAELGLPSKRTREPQETMRQRAEELLQFDAPAKPRKR